MDATRIDYPRTIAGCVAVIFLLCAGILLGRCSAPAAAQETQPAPEPVVSLGYDFQTAAGEALAELEVYLHSVTTTTTTLPRQARQAVNYQPGDGSRWDQLAQCETGGNWSANTGNGYGGGLQFAHSATWSTWISYGGAQFAPNPWDASREQQIEVAENVLARSGWRAWPGCASRLGLR